MITLIVKSSDGVEFAIPTQERAVPYELKFAASQPSQELDRNPDFVRVSAPLTEQTPAPVPKDETPAACGTEALCRAQVRWHGGVAIIDGDKP